MRLTRVYVDAPLVPGTRITLEGSAASHVTRVLRLRTGDALTLFNGRGGEHAASIDKSQAGVVTVAIGEHRAEERESPLAIALAQGLSRGERMDLVVQKATELGVTQLLPLLTERSVVRLDAQQAHRKLNHWHANAVAACEQSGRNRLPEVMAPATLRDFCARVPKAPRRAGSAPAAATVGGTRLLLSPAAAVRIDEVPRPAGGVTVLIGPEGGLTEAEEEAARTAGFIPVRLGPRVFARRPQRSPRSPSCSGSSETSSGVSRQQRESDAEPVGVTGDAQHYALILVSSAIISSRRSRSGTSGVSFTMRIWQTTGMRSGNTRELSARTTSELTRTSCGIPARRLRSCRLRRACRARAG